MKGEKVILSMKQSDRGTFSLYYGKTAYMVGLTFQDAIKILKSALKTLETNKSLLVRENG